MAYNAKHEHIAAQVEKAFSAHQHYYLKVDSGDSGDSGRHRIGTVFVGLTSDGDVCRGISICSTTETFNKDEGWCRSAVRALRATKKKEHTLPVIVSVTEGDDDSGDKLYIAPASVLITIEHHGEILQSEERSEEGNFGYKSQFAVTPTEAEKKILHLGAPYP